MQIQSLSISCGVHQVFGLAHYAHRGVQELMTLLSESTSPVTGMIVFSDADEIGNGLAIAADITKLFKRGTLTVASQRNPNSGNHIKTWVWAPDWSEVSEWMAQHKIGERRQFSKERVKKIWWAYRDPDIDEGSCGCEDCCRDRNDEWNDDAN